LRKPNISSRYAVSVKVNILIFIHRYFLYATKIRHFYHI
jgi:hypothetical protein